jgi:hypothetical protein
MTYVLLFIVVTLNGIAISDLDLARRIKVSNEIMSNKKVNPPNLKIHKVEAKRQQL